MHLSLLVFAGFALCALSLASLLSKATHGTWALALPSLTFGAGTATIVAGLVPDGANFFVAGGVGICLASGFYGIAELFVLANPSDSAPVVVEAQAVAPSATAIVGGEDADAAQEAIAVGVSAVAAAEPGVVESVTAEVRGERPAQEDLFRTIVHERGDGRKLKVTFSRHEEGAAIAIRTENYGKGSFYELVVKVLEAHTGFGWNTKRDPKNKGLRTTTGKASLDRLAQIRAVLETIG